MASVRAQRQALAVDTLASLVGASVSTSVVIIISAVGVVWALRELVWLRGKRRELEQLTRDVERFQAGDE